MEQKCGWFYGTFTHDNVGKRFGKLTKHKFSLPIARERGGNRNDLRKHLLFIVAPPRPALFARLFCAILCK